MDVFTHIMRLTPHSVRSKLRGIKPEGIKEKIISLKYRKQVCPSLFFRVTLIHYKSKKVFPSLKQSLLKY